MAVGILIVTGATVAVTAAALYLLSRSQLKKGANMMLVKHGDEDKTSALIFDCDGVLADTEPFHLISYNAAFAQLGLHVGGEPVAWSDEYYSYLCTFASNGWARMRFFFDKEENQRPTSHRGELDLATETERDALIGELLAQKAPSFG